ncbi:MAG: hypothetical protein GWO84_01510 [Euryarchaeota archaeon]|nr:hypothetical protein [Euryarchaeota archaeon]
MEGVVLAGRIALILILLLALRTIYKKDKNKQQRLADIAHREKYGGVGEIESIERDGLIVLRSRQTTELSENEYSNYLERDSNRDQNFMDLRLILSDIIVDINDDEDIDDEQRRMMELDGRGEWIEDNQEELEQHSALVAEEEIGSGITIAETPTDDDMDERLEREGGKSGAVQVTLSWDDYNDLDLHLFCPDGERIYFNNKTSNCGGVLDVDMNVKPVSNNPVENIVWENIPNPGKYKVGVHFYKHFRKKRSKKTCQFRLRVVVDSDSREYQGSITYGQAIQMVTTFTILPRAIKELLE